MAEKRIFTKKITESDAFLDMPLSSQCLYFHLNMNADDDGFINNPKKVMRMIGASDDDLKILIGKSFLIVFENKGLILIKHWWLHNVLRKDRYKETEYLEEKAMVSVKDNKVYTLNGCQNGANLVPDGCRNINQYKVIENKINKHKYGEYKNVLLSDEELEKLKSEFPDWKQRIERVSEYCASTGKTYKNYLATIRNWARKNNNLPEDSLPVYDPSMNKDMSESETNELLSLMGKKGQK